MTSFSPGRVTVLYYCVAIPITIVLGILIYFGVGALGDLLSHSNSAFVSLVASVISLIAYSAIFLLVFPMLSLGRKVRAREQRRRQLIRDDAAAKIARPGETPSALHDRPPLRRYVLYLRPFWSTGKFGVLLERKVLSHRIPGARTRLYATFIWGDLETTMAEAIEPLGTFLALGHPGEHIGAGRVLIDDSHWQNEFTHLAHGAERILIVPSTHAGTKWELGQLLSHPGLLRKAIFILPPGPVSLPLPGVKYAGVEHIFKFEALAENEVRRIRREAIESMKLLKIDLPVDYENGLFLRIDAKRQVLAAIRFYAGVADGRTISAASIRSAITKLSSSTTN
jgi:hypothetical protein